MRSKLFSKLDSFLKVEFGKLDFGLENEHYSGVFFSGICRKHHYRYPIVAFFYKRCYRHSKTSL